MSQTKRANSKSFALLKAGIKRNAFRIQDDGLFPEPEK